MDCDNKPKQQWIKRKYFFTLTYGNESTSEIKVESESMAHSKALIILDTVERCKQMQHIKDMRQNELANIKIQFPFEN